MERSATIFSTGFLWEGVRREKEGVAEPQRKKKVKNVCLKKKQNNLCTKERTPSAWAMGRSSPRPKSNNRGGRKVEEWGARRKEGEWNLIGG